MPIINNRKVDELNFEYGAYVDYHESTPTLKYGTKPGVIVVRKGNLDTKVGCDSFDNSLGGIWNYYISIPIITSPSEDIQYKVEITDTSVNVYSNDGTKVIATGTCGNFWDETNQVDIRVFDENLNQNHFWVEEFDMTNKKAVIWIKLHSGQKEVGIAYGNKDCVISSYCNGDNVFEFFDDFEGDKLDTNKWVSNYVNVIEYTLSNSVLRLTNTNGAWIYDNTDSGAQIKANVDLPLDCIIEAKERFPTQLGERAGQSGISLCDNNHIVRVNTSQYDSGCTTIYASGGYTFIESVKSSGVNINPDTWYIHKIIRNNTNINVIDPSCKISGTSANISYLAITACNTGSYSFCSFEYDYIMVRKYLSTDLSFDTPTIKQF